jgi:hypothetical protein
MSWNGNPFQVSSSPIVACEILISLWKIEVFGNARSIDSNRRL